MADALLIIDMQTGLYDGPEKPFERERVLDTINQLILRARQADAPIFVARHTGPAGSPIEAGSPYWQLWYALEVDEARDHLFNKSRPSCFLGTDLAHQLRAAQVSELVIVGMKTQFCIDTTCRVAVELGSRCYFPKAAIPARTPRSYSKLFHLNKPIRRTNPAYSPPQTLQEERSDDHHCSGSG